MSNVGSVKTNGINCRILLPLFLGLILFASTVGATGTPPTDPSDPKTLAFTSTSIDWSWQDTSSDESGFMVWTDPGDVAPSTLSATTPADTVSWLQSGLAANSLYSFQVAATGIYGTSARTVPITAWTLAQTAVEPVIKTVPDFEVAVGANDGNPAHTLYAIACTTLGKWVQSDGSLGGAYLFQTAATWGSVAITQCLHISHPHTSRCCQRLQSKLL